MGYVDSHCHLYFDRFDDDRAEVVARARDAGFTQIMNIGIDVPTSRQALALTREYPGFCFASAGLHPTETNVEEAELEETVAEIETLLGEDAVRALGEIGLDYYWDKSPPERQAVAFRRQLELAAKRELPVIIHCRDAMDDTLAIVTEFADRVRGVFHCFSGDAAQARRVHDLGWYLSFAGNVTFPKAEVLREAARASDPTRLLLETDSPFLAPQPVRGQRNEPAFALHTGDFLAELYGMPVEDFRDRSSRNARELFDLPE